MPALFTALGITAAAVSFAVAFLMWRVGLRAGAFDSAPMPGQVKERRRVPNTGGVGIFAGIVLPVALALALAWGVGEQSVASLIGDDLARHLPGLRAQTGLALLMLASMALLHAVGLIDDRRPLGPMIKLGVMALPPLVLALATDTRLLTLLDAHAGGAWLSVALTVVWFVAVTNAMNFIDNMDGLSAGVAAIAGSCMLAGAVMSGQWFIAACLALLIGSCLGFLILNFPPARLFMGDSGSLVLGFTLAFLTTRMTYTGESPTGEPLAGGWYAVFMPLVVLAVPLYDMLSVTAIRLSQGKSPFVGDMQHLSHRLVRRGLSKRAAVFVIWGMTAATGIGGIALGSLSPWQAVLVGVQTAALLGVLAAFEFASSSAANGGRDD